MALLRSLLNTDKSKKSTALEVKSSQKNKLPTHESLLNHLNNRDLNNLKEELNILKEHYSEEKLHAFINQPLITFKTNEIYNKDIDNLLRVVNAIKGSDAHYSITKLENNDFSSSEDKFSDNDSQSLIREINLLKKRNNGIGLSNFIEELFSQTLDPILHTYVKAVINSNTPLNNNCQQLAEFSYQAIQLLVQHGAYIQMDDIKPLRQGNNPKESLLFSVMRLSLFSPCEQDLLNETIFQALVEAGADLTVVDDHGFPLSEDITMRALHCRNYNFYAHYLIVECGFELRESTMEELNNVIYASRKERIKKENEYSQEKSVIFKSLPLPSDLINLTWGYFADYSPAFFKSIEKNKSKTTVNDNKPNNQYQL